MKKKFLSFGGYRFPLPQTKIMRIVAGCAFIVGGILGFLPVLGFWMFPLGLIILAVDFPLVRRGQRRFQVWVGRWWKSVKKRKER